MRKAEGEDQVAIVWFRQDLRLADHPALLAAMSGGRRVLALYVLDDASPGAWRMGGASRWWLHHSLLSLEASLKALGATLVLRRGAADVVLPEVLAESGASEVHAGRMHEPWARLLEGQLETALPKGALRLHRTTTLFDLEAIRTKTGGIYGVYTPFARGLRLRGDPPAPLPAPERILAAADVRSDRLEDWELLPTRAGLGGGAPADLGGWRGRGGEAAGGVCCTACEGLRDRAEHSGAAGDEHAFGASALGGVVAGSGVACGGFGGACAGRGAGHVFE